jgi:hypothetical protein
VEVERPSCSIPFILVCASDDAEKGGENCRLDRDCSDESDVVVKGEGGTVRLGALELGAKLDDMAVVGWKIPADVAESDVESVGAKKMGCSTTGGEIQCGSAKQ